MNQTKRHSYFNKSLLIGTKKERTTSSKEKISITSIENFSNELFYEIFIYLDGRDIYKAFFNLNSRFQHLITSSSLPLKIKLHPEAKIELLHCCKSVIIPNRHRILSLDLENNLFIHEFFKHCIIDSSFDRLESIALNEISIDQSLVVLFYSKSLPRLFSLIMNVNAILGCDLDNIYREIFSFQFLKYNKLSISPIFGNEDMNISVPLAIPEPLVIIEQYNTIEYLIINHWCTINELLSMLHHTPRLRHLTCHSLSQLDTNINTEQSVTLPNLTYICLIYPLMTLNDFEMFMMKLSAQVQVLIMKDSFDDTYFDAHGWERLILKCMPHLRRFDLTFHRCFDIRSEDASLDELNELINRFTSSFWIERQWFFELIIDDASARCSIHPYRNIWLDIYKNAEIAIYFNQNTDYNFTKQVIMSDRQDTNYSATQCLPIIQVCISGLPPYARNQLTDTFKSISITVQFTRLDINCKDIPIGLFVRIIHLLPNLDSLKVSCLSLIRPNWLPNDDKKILYLTSINNKITKVNLEKMINIEPVNFLLELCLCIKYFQMDVPEGMDLEMLVRFILIKSTTCNSHLCSLCLSIANAHEEIVHQLQKMIESEKLLTNFMIKRICNHILLKWN